MAFAERMKAIHEGRYDDARIIQLQQLADNQDFNNQLNDLDKKHADDVKKHRQDKRTAQLEKEKEQLQKQLDAQRAALQKQIDAQRAALQKQFDLEKAALQKRQDLQTKMLQQQQDAEREFLNNMFSELNEQMPKNKKEWGKYWDDVKKLAREQGVSVNGVMKQYADVWHQTLAQGLQDSINDAARISGDVGAATGAGLNAGYNKQKQKGLTPEDKQLYKNIQNFLGNLSSSAGNFTPKQLKSWLSVLASSYQDSAQSGDTTIARNLIRTFSDPNNRLHTGGPVPGGAKADVPATLQQGEFVVQRDAVSKYGPNLLHSINQKKFNAPEFHTGGIVGDALKLGLYNTEAKAITDSSMLGVFGKVTSGYLRGLIQSSANITGGFIKQALGAIRAARAPTSGPSFKTNYSYPTPPVSAGDVHPLTYSNQTWPDPPGVPAGGVEASTSGTASERNYYARLLKAFKGWDVANAGVYVRKLISGTDMWSQHSWGNAVDVVIGSTGNVLANPEAQAKMDMLAGWTAENHSALRVATQLWRANADHMNHMHVDFWPQGTGTPPVMHGGGIYTGNNKFKNLSGLRFQGPAILQSGEAVLPRNVVKALNTIGGQPQAGMEKNVFNINVEIKGDLYGDDQSYEKLYSTLERAGSKIARNRGMGNNSVVRVGVRNAYS